MRVVAIAVLLLVSGCATAQLDLESYALGDVTKIATHCAVADPVLVSERGEGLPSLVDTQPERVARVLEETREELLLAYEGVNAVVAPRNGQVLSGAAGVATVRDAQDSLIVVEISGDSLCPTEPTFWNGIPIAFFREGYLD
ncbi:MAG: hypothetical protein HKN91_07080 [Acidimicrobiia bacterium]|nr:hypothetical protein [Acidimicrobiia bacterium]